MPTACRRVDSIAEITGLEGATPLLQELFVFRRAGRDGRRVLGEFTPTGIVPRMVEDLKELGVSMPLSLFSQGQSGMSVVLAVGAVLFAGLSAYLYGSNRARQGPGPPEFRRPGTTGPFRRRGVCECCLPGAASVGWGGRRTARRRRAVDRVRRASQRCHRSRSTRRRDGAAREEAVAGARSSTIESQLSEVIDLLSAALRAGASVLAAFEATLRDARPPIRPYLQQFVGRVRLGEDPRLVVMSLADQVPLETFRLFTTALAVHWDVGGSLASTTRHGGPHNPGSRRTRSWDTRRVSRRARRWPRGPADHLPASYLMWRASPERVEAFVRLQGVGTALTAVAITLQAVGLVWMSRLSRSGF